MKVEELLFAIDYFCITKKISKVQLLKRLKYTKQNMSDFTEKDKERLCYFLEVDNLKVEPETAYEKYIYYKLKNKFTDEKIANDLGVSVNILRSNVARYFNPISPCLLEKIADLVQVDEFEFKVAAQNAAIRELDRPRQDK